MSSCRLVVYSAIASAIVVLTLTGERSAAALEIKLRFDSGFAAYPDAQLAIEAAAHRWEATLADPMEAAIDIRLSKELDFFTGAESSVVEGLLPYVELRDALAADVTTSDDATATAQLPPGPFLSFRTLASDRSPVVNAGNEVINEYAVLSSANAKALGFDVGQLESDGEIWFNQVLLDFHDFDVDPTNGVQGFDLTGVATHEMAHILGFNSGVDTLDLVFHPGPIPPDLAAGLQTPEEINDYSVLEALDLFRYSAASAGLIDVTPGADAFFSLDGGASAIAAFATGALNGDGSQAGHWRGGSGILDAVLDVGTAYQITAIDLRALDVIGWDRRAVPEPATLMMLLVAAAGGCFGRGQAAKRAPTTH